MPHFCQTSDSKQRTFYLSKWPCFSKRLINQNTTGSLILAVLTYLRMFINNFIDFLDFYLCYLQIFVTLTTFSYFFEKVKSHILRLRWARLHAREKLYILLWTLMTTNFDGGCFWKFLEQLTLSSIFFKKMDFIFIWSSGQLRDLWSHYIYNFT